MTAAALLLAGLLAPVAVAHVVVAPGPGDRPENATEIPGPGTPVFLLDAFRGHGGVHYYGFHATEGDSLHLRLALPPEAAMEAGLVLLGPGVVDHGFPPDAVEVPEGMGAWDVPGRADAPVVVDPLYPAAYRVVAELVVTANASGDHLVVVYAAEAGGGYALVTGAPGAVAPGDWLRIPLLASDVYLWSGRPWLAVSLPPWATLGVGVLGIYAARRGRPRLEAPFGWAAAGAGLLFAASAAALLVQTLLVARQGGTAPRLLLPVGIAGAALALSGGTLAVALARRRRVTRRDRALLALLGAAGLVAWAGFVLGPTVALLGALLPSRAPPPPAAAGGPP